MSLAYLTDLPGQANVIYSFKPVVTASDGTVRVPIWRKGECITADQYEVVRDTSMRLRYGTRTVARA